MYILYNFILTYKHNYFNDLRDDFLKNTKILILNSKYSNIDKCLDCLGIFGGNYGRIE